MSGDWDNYIAGDQIKKYKREDPPKWRINTLLTELLEKDEEIALYKKRLKELETAFYYNLELIAERDLELSVLENQMGSENEQLQHLIQERNELEDLIRVIDDKYNKKIKQLETKLALKGEEIKDIQRENIARINTMKRLLDDAKHQQEKKITKLSTKFEIRKTELIKAYQEEMEEKEKYYLLEIDNLAGKLAQVGELLRKDTKEIWRDKNCYFQTVDFMSPNCRQMVACLEKEELLKAGEENKAQLEDVKKLFLEKENQYLEEIRRKSNSFKRKVSREAQCNIKPQVFEKKIQAQPDITTANSQTVHDAEDTVEDEYVQKINFLREQNEVLKHIVKDLKRNRDVGAKPEEAGLPPGCECLQIRTEIEQVNKKFECEINNLKKILEEEHMFRAEEDVVIQSLEASVTFLKEKLLLDLQEKLDDFQGDDICEYTYNREIQNEIQVTLLERKLSNKIDSFVTVTQEENREVRKKLDELKKECMDKLERYLKPESEFRRENLLQLIRMEIQQLEDKIESDMKNLVRNNCEKNKCDKNYESKLEFTESRCASPKTSFPVFPDVQAGLAKCQKFPKGSELDGSIGIYCRNNLSPEKYISIFKCARQANIPNQTRKRLGEQKDLRRVKNNLVLGR